MFLRLWSVDLALQSATAKKILGSRSMADDKTRKSRTFTSYKQSSGTFGECNKINGGTKAERIVLNSKESVEWEKLSQHEKEIVLVHNTACEVSDT